MFYLNEAIITAWTDFTFVCVTHITTKFIHQDSAKIEQSRTEIEGTPSSLYLLIQQQLYKQKKLYRLLETSFCVLNESRFEHQRRCIVTS
jgi:hypothetical protein